MVGRYHHPGRERIALSSPKAVLRHPFVQVSLLSSVFSQIGIWVRNFSVLLFVMEKSGGDAFAVSMISVAEYGPIFLFSFIGGVFADRWKPKKTMVWCDVLSAVSVFLVLAALLFGEWQAVFLATLGSAICSQFSQPSGMKLFKQHLPDEQMQTGSISLLQTVFAVFMVLGPLLGTLVYQSFGIVTAMVLTGIAFLLSGAMLTLIPADRELSREAGAGQQTSLFREMAEGIRCVCTQRNLLFLSLCFAAVGLGVGLISPLSIFVVTEKLGLPPHYLQWMSIPYGLGEIIGGVLTFAAASKIAPERLLALGLLVNAAAIVGIGLSQVLWLTLLAQFVLALLQPAIFVGNNALVMRQTDAAFIGRVMGIRTPLMTGSMVAMMSVAGILKEMCSLTSLFLLAGGFFLIGLLFTLPVYRGSANASGSIRSEADHA
ncbi:MFS transporter [Brevibacillus sp. B_LB10_24]|uniref:MFS transporter n=1 Tax=Brevibacillus sp. B_LB10_24 TaxID=3380645 RepID=UPI0038B962FE